MKASLIIRTGFIIIYMWANFEASAQHRYEKGDSTTISSIGAIRLAGGGQMTFYEADNRLDALNGKNPLAGEVFIRLYPKLMKM